MLGGSHVEVRSQNSLYQFIHGQYYFGIPRGVRMSLALNEPKEVALHPDSNNTSKHTPQVERNYRLYMQNNQWNMIEEQLPR